MPDSLARSTGAEPQASQLFSPVAAAPSSASALLEAREPNSVLFSLEDLARTEVPETPAPARLATRPTNDGGSGLIDLSELVGADLTGEVEPDKQSGDAFAATGSLLAEINAARAVAPTPTSTAPAAKASAMPTFVLAFGTLVVVATLAAVAIKVL